MSSTIEKQRRPARAPDLNELLQRQVPFNSEAEISLLGSIVLLPDVYDDVVTIVRPDDFHDPANRIIFEHLVKMHNDDRKIDIALLREKLISSGQYEAAGGAAYLAQVFNAVPNAAHATYYAGIVREKSIYRNLIGACTEILHAAYESQDDPERSLSWAEERIFGITDARASGDVATLETVLHETIDRMDARMRGEHSTGTVESGFTDLDRLTGGLHASEFVVLAARPSMGKTALAMNIAEHVVFHEQQPVLFVSLEMAAIELVERLLCSMTRVDSYRLRNNTLSIEDRKRLSQKAAEIASARMFIDDSPNRTVSEIAGAARRIKRKQNGLGLIVIDYLQLIQPDDPKDPRQEQVAGIARRLKKLSRELKVPILCLSQLNRQAEETRDHLPRLSHLRESGAIEQDADVVMFIHREEYFLSEEERSAVEGEAKLIVAKQRNGPTGTLKLAWIKGYTRFENLAPDRHAAFDSFEE
jgi:replicative DNA helicase